MDAIAVPARRPRTRSQRLEARITPDQKALIERAAALEGRSVTDFVLQAVQAAARQSILEHQRIALPAEDSQLVARTLADSPDPPARLRRAMREYQGTVRS
jgi:uncharacterized protein (DUF1778 family)